MGVCQLLPKKKKKKRGMRFGKKWMDLDFRFCMGSSPQKKCKYFEAQDFGGSILSVSVGF